MTQRDEVASTISIRTVAENEVEVEVDIPRSLLRDCFAGQALSSIPLRSWDYLSSGDDKVRAWATLAYAVADAMLAARSPQPDPRDELLREAASDLNAMLTLYGMDEDPNEMSGAVHRGARATLDKIQKELGDG